MDTTVNSQITDAVTQSNASTLGAAPAMALSTVYQSLAHAVGLSMQNAVSAQQNTNTILQATTTSGVSLIYGLTGADAGAAGKQG